MKISKVVKKKYSSKKRDNTKLDNFRPLAILPIFQKSLENFFMYELLLLSYWIPSKKTTKLAIIQLIEKLVLNCRYQAIDGLIDLNFVLVGKEILLYQLEMVGIEGI